MAIALATACARQSGPAPVELNAEERAWLAAHGPLRFAADPAFPPIEWFGDSGTYRGLVADYFRLIEARLGVPIEIVRLASWEEVLAQARRREIDGITAAQATPERAAYMDWTPPLLEIPNVVIIRAGAGGDVSLEELAGKRVAITAGYELEERLRRDHPSIQFVRLSDDLSCLTAVSFGRADATVINLAVASYLIQRHGITNLRMTADSGHRYALSIATRSDQPLLGVIMARGLAAVTPAERKAIQERWIRFEAGPMISRRTVTRSLVGAAAALVALIALALTWSRTMKARVAAATAGLQAELTERHRAEAALRRSERKLALHLDQTVVGVVEFDRELRVVYWNPAAERIFGWTRSEALGQPWDFMLPADQRGAVKEVWQSLHAGSGGWQNTNHTLTRDGRSILCEWFNTALRDDDGRITGFMSVAVDVSDRERRVEATARAQRLESLAILAGGIAHDFNNLLTGILANLSLVQTDHPPPEEHDEMVREAEAAAHRAQSLTRQLLTFSKGGAPAKAVLDLAPVVREAASFAVRGAAGALDLDLSEGLWPVEADAGQVDQVVHNLVLNALEALPGGTVQVSLGNEVVEEGGPPVRPGAYVRLRVTDRGPGIPAELQPKIFDPFYSTKQRGSGLGLAVSHSIVTRHGGAMEVRSKPGEGTTFEVFFPACPGRTPRRVMPRSGSCVVAAAAAVARGRVMVMDDEETIRRVAERVLSGMGCDVVAVADGAEAVALHAAAREAGRPFDLVVLDLTVPGAMGGVEALARMRQLDPEVRAVVSSGYSDAATLTDHRSHGFVAVMPKPWTAVDLRRVVVDSMPGEVIRVQSRAQPPPAAGPAA